jgi:Kef-type K+ transport system membrane component KefB
MIFGGSSRGSLVDVAYFRPKLEMTVSDINAYGLVIGGSLIIILSYFANLLAKRTNIPSVLVLIGMGIAIRQGLNAMGLTSIPFESLVLELLGTIGLIFIVLEAALDLNLSRDKMPLIVRSASVALIALLGSSAAIAAFLGYSMGIPWFEGWVYAIPLSIMSSAIIIPSVSSLSPQSREFMVYESTFSDIFGIMAFYLLLGNSDAESTQSVIRSIGTNLFVTLLLAIFVSYILVYVLQKITSPVKLFLSIAVLLLIYAIQKLLHLSPLVLILIFGLMLNNHHLFFPKWPFFRKSALGQAWPENLLDDERMHDLHRDYHLLTLESAFVIRTFFFVIFGMTVSLAALTDLHIITEGLVICCLLFAVRFLCLLLLQRRAVFPLLYIAPRGLITILLFFQIQSTYPQYLQPAFDQGILLVIILITSVIMTIALVQNGITLRGVTVLPEIIPDEGEPIPDDPPQMSKSSEEERPDEEGSSLPPS